MIEFQVLAFIFVFLASVFSLMLLIFVIKFNINKKKQLQIMEKFNAAKSVQFNVRQKLINNLSEFNSQIDVICEYSISFEKEYFYALKNMENDLNKLNKINNIFSFKKTKMLEKIINDNFFIMNESLLKHDAIIEETINSFKIISKIAVFYQKIVKDIIIRFEEHISIKHHSPAINQFLDEISQSLIIIEKNKLVNDINEVNSASIIASKTIKNLINYLKDVNVILLYEPYILSKIEKIEKLIHKHPNFFKTKGNFLDTEKEIMKLKNYVIKISKTYDESQVQIKKPLVNKALNAFKNICRDINHRIESQNIGKNSIEQLLEWINYLIDNKSTIVPFLNNISKLFSANNSQINSDSQIAIEGIITYIDKIISYKKIFNDNSSIEAYGAEMYIKLIKKVLNLINDLKILIINFSKSISRISEFTMFIIRLINTYKLTLLKLNGRNVVLQSKNRSSYDPIIIIDRLNQIEQNVFYYAINPSQNDAVNHELSEINYKIIEINAMIYNDEKLVNYLKKIVLRFNKFYNKSEYEIILEKVMNYYNKGDYYNSVKYLIKKYNKLEKKYNSNKEEK